jgi:flagellar hook-associated protein 3 FlgL
MNSFSLNGLLNTALSNSIGELRTQIADRAQEATTGKQADLISHLNGRIDHALLGDKALKENADDQARIELRQIRLSLSENTMGSIRDLTEGLSLEMHAAIGIEDTQRQNTVAAEAREALDEVLSRLNVRHGERYLFSGDATATAPFLDADTLLNDLRVIAAGATDEADFATQVQTYFDDPAGGFQTSFYQGTQTASDGDAVLANQTAFSDMFMGLAIMSLNEPGAVEPYAAVGTPIMDVALERLERGRTLMVDVEAGIGIRQDSLRAELDLLGREALLLTSSMQDLTGKDQYEAATQLKELEANLEASYLLTSRLSNLSLLNFLR